jgi:hypothetical protein
MTKNDKVKLGVAGGAFALALVVLVWYFFLSTPEVTPLEAPPAENTGRPNTRTPGG